MPRHLGTYAAIGWSSTSDTVGERVHQLAVPLRETGAGFSQATFRAQSLDRSTISALQVPSGASEYVAEVRYDDDPQGLIDLLRAGNRNETLNYYPDVRDPGQVWAMKLIAPTGDDIETQLDAQRAAFGDHGVQLRLRRTAGPIAQQQGTNVLFWYRGGGSLESCTFTRATATTRIDKGRGQYAGVLSGQAVTGWYDTDGDGVRELAALVLAPLRTNVCLQSESFGTTPWVANGTPTRVAGAKTCGTVSLDLIGDDSGVNQEYYSQAVTFTGNATKAISVHLAAGPSQAAGGSQILLSDTSAVADRLAATVTWSAAGVPSVVASTGTYLGAVALTNGVYRLFFRTTTVTAANTNVVYVIPAQTANQQGNVYAGGVQAENAVYPGEYIPTTTINVTRNADTVSFPFTPVPQALTCYIRFVEVGAILDSGNSANLLLIGTSNPRVLVRWNGTAYEVNYMNAVGASVVSSTATNPTLGQSVELVATITTAGVVQLTHVYAGGGGPVANAASAAQSLPSGGWGTATLQFGDGHAGLLNVCMARGVQSLDAMRRIAKL